MSGGLMQIVAQGAQDKYLTRDPEITFFKSMHRRHTNFAVESIEQTFNGSVGNSSRVSATISRNGDLVHRMWLEIDCDKDIFVAIKAGRPPILPKSRALVYDLIKNVTVEIGGTRVDSHTGAWMYISDNLSCPASKRTNLDRCIGYGPSSGQHSTNADKKFRIPLSFWFCKDAGQALPLIALQYHEVKVSVEFGDGVGLHNGGNVAIQGAKLWVDYIYLDTAERRRFARSAHEYLIEQVQSTGDETGNKIRLDFNHPVKELLWTAEDMETAKLQLNGHDRFAERDAKYFKHVQQYQHHTGMSADTYVYSFALEPEKLQPSGTCNFSRIDNATLKMTGTTGTSVVYAVNYNVLRIKNGMGGLAYSN